MLLFLHLLLGISQILPLLAPWPAWQMGAIIFVTVGDTETHLSKVNQLVEEEAKIQNLICWTLSHAGVPI